MGKQDPKIKSPLVFTSILILLGLLAALSAGRGVRPSAGQAVRPGPQALAPIPYVQQTEDGKIMVTAPVDPVTGKADLAAVPKDLLPQLSTLERIELRRVNPDGSQSVVGTAKPSDFKRR